MYKHQGSMLLELVTGVLLGGLLLGLLVDQMRMVSQLLSQQSDRMTLQDTAMTSMQILQKSILMAGYLPCKSAWFRSNIHTAIPGYEDFFSADQMVSVANRHVVLHQASDKGAHLLMVNSQKIVVTQTGIDLQAGDIVVLSDCHQAEINQIASVQSVANERYVTFQYPLFYSQYQAGSINKLSTQDYFIQATGRQDQSGHGISALYLANETGVKREWVAHVHDFSAALDGFMVTLHLSVRVGGLSRSFSFVVPLLNAQE